MTVVIILSDKRSGSTLLEDEICRHPDIARVFHTPHTFRETHHFAKGAVLLGMDDSLFHGWRRNGRYGSPANARALMVDCIRGNVPGFLPPQDDRALVFAGWEALCATFARPVFLEKSPQHLASWAALSLMLEWIAETTRPVRVIGLTRNPMAVMYSARALFGTDAESRQYSWLASARNLLAFSQMLPADGYHQVRYEDLVTDPQGELAALFSFIGVDPAACPRGGAVDAASLEGWRRDPSFGLQLSEPVRQMARHLGYDDASLRNPVVDEALVRGAAAGEKSLPRRLKRSVDGFAARIAKPLALRLNLARPRRVAIPRPPSRTAPPA